MTPIKRITTDSSGIKRETLTLDPFAFLLNTIAMGDVIAAAPVVKYMTDNYYVTPESYRVIAKAAFRPFFPFVPDGNWVDFEDQSRPFWGIPDGMPVGLLNKKNEAKFVRNTPKNMHLSHYASLCFSDSIIPLEHLEYVPIQKTSVDHFGVDFSRAVVLITSYRDVTREWHSTEILKLAKWLQSKNVTPVFIGKTNMDLHLEKKHLIPKSNLPDDVSEYGVDLRNRTSIVELASIMDQAIAVCGVDSGPIHIAGTTRVPIICGYSTVAAEHRIPTRRSGITIPIVPSIACANCESRWRTSYHNFEHCYYGHVNCCAEFTAERYIEHLEKLV